MTTTISGLPQELTDHIIDHIDDRKSLKACSLVCSQWSPRSRKHLFVRLQFTDKRDLQHWCARIRPGPSGASSLVEDLTLLEYYPSTTAPPPSPTRLCPSFFTDAASHFQSFSALQALNVLKWRMTTDCVLSMLHSFGSSLENVTRLTLSGVYVRPSTLAMFVGHFPCLDITASDISGTLDGTNAVDSSPWAYVSGLPTYTRGRSGAPHIPKCQVPKGVFETITLLKPRFNRVILAYVSYTAWRDYWPLIEACAGSLEELRIFADATGEWTHIDL